MVRLWLTTFPFFGGRFGWRFRTRWSFGSRLISFTSSMQIIICRRISMSCWDAPEQWSVRALRLLQVWLHHIVVIWWWLVNVVVIVVTWSVVVNNIESKAGVRRMNIVVTSVCVAKLKSIDVVDTLRNSLEDCFDLQDSKLTKLSPTLLNDSNLKVLAEHLLLVFMSIINFRFVQFKYHIAIRIGCRKW